MSKMSKKQKKNIEEILNNQATLLKIVSMQRDGNYYAQLSYIDGLLLGLQLSGHDVFHDKDGYHIAG